MGKNSHFAPSSLLPQQPVVLPIVPDVAVQYRCGDNIGKYVLSYLSTFSSLSYAALYALL
jgi:hypothetical protein